MKNDFKEDFLGPLVVFLLLLIFILFVVGYGIGYHNALPKDHTLDQVTKTITIKRMLTENEVNETGGLFSGFIITSTEGIAYWSASDTIYFGFDVGETYCVRVSPNLPQGPIIEQNYGLGECK